MLPYMDLKTYIEKEGLSKRAFAERVDATPEAVRLWAAGKRFPRPGAIRKIMAATDGAVTVTDFFSMEDHQ